MANIYTEAIGRRKLATARVRVFSGTGTFTVNDKDLNAYFTRQGDTQAILFPMEVAGQSASNYDVTVHVNGGGVSGQRDAVKLGVARVMLKMDETTRHLLRDKGLLTRDARIKERKKPGLKRARKAPTYTKR